MPQLIERSKRRRSADIDLTSLVDVVFLLLIFFLVTSQFEQPKASLELPPGSPGAAPDESAIQVELTQDGVLKVNGEDIPDGAYEAALKNSLATSSTRKIRFYGDRRIDYGHFVDLLDRARSLGIDDFAIVKSQHTADEPAANR